MSREDARPGGSLRASCPRPEAPPPTARTPGRQDPADYLLRILGSSALRDHDVVLQALFQNRGWESTFFSPLFDSVAPGRIIRFAPGCTHDHVRRRTTSSSEPTSRDRSRVMRWLAWACGCASGRPRPGRHGGTGRSSRRGRSGRSTPRSSTTTFDGSLPRRRAGTSPEANSPTCSASRGPRTTRSARTRAHRADNPAPNLLPRPILLPRPHLELRLIVGLSGLRPVALPKTWNHAAVIGRTQSGKSTLALSLALQILRKQPESDRGGDRANRDTRRRNRVTPLP